MKAILVFDMPTTCTDCPCYDFIHGVCANTHKDCELRKQEKPSWCPLKPLPETKDVGYPIDDYAVGFGDGWNAYLKEITDHIGESTEKFCNDDLYESWMFFDEGETE